MGFPEISNRHGSAPRDPGPARRRPERSAWSRRGVLAAFGAVVPALALSGCGDPAGAAEKKDATTGGADGAGPTAKTQVRTPAVTVSPADGTKGAGFTAPVVVSVTNGTLSAVEVAGNDGSVLAGSFDADRTRWTSDRNPYSGTEYTVRAKAAGAAEHTATFVTKSPAETFAGHFTPEANSTSGVGMPVSIDFTHAVTDRAAVEKAITVTAEPAVEVVGHWFGSTRLDFRPAEYWAAGTKITPSLRLRDVEGADDGSVAGYRFYESSMLGDVVVVRNSGERTVEASNGLNGWNLSWADWKAGSAL
ncbi:Ig-like domain-containing protein [Streptomyces sp. NPDC058751]|uniref:Ig-like domain-containing protein n=1 Tax=Streptomyces sp. NPDC058751 TaxID=3346623 RepID=UPI0036C35F2E